MNFYISTKLRGVIRNIKFDEDESGEPDFESQFVGKFLVKGL